MGTVQSRHLHPRNPALAQMSYYSQGKAQMDDADEGSGCCVGLPSSLPAPFPGCSAVRGGLAWNATETIMDSAKRARTRCN